MCSTKQIVYLFLPYHNSGGHFISWTLNYLSNQTVYQTHSKHYCPVEDIGNYNNKINFHHHQCCRIQGLEQAKQEYQNLDKFPGQTKFVYLYCLSWQEVALSKYNVDINNVTKEQIKECKKIASQDTIDMFKWIQDSQHPLIMFTYNQEDLLNIFYNDRQPVDMYGRPRNTLTEALDEINNIFFKESIQKFDTHDIWDRREQLALTLQLVQYQDYRLLIDRTKPHLSYNTADIWHNFENIVPTVLKFLNLNLDEDRLVLWKKVYSVWKEKHDPYFSRHFDEIIDAIVNNYYMDLTPYNMNFYHEVLIQHALIHRHNLNFKTWQLEKFSNNTQVLHQLLEPNIHKL